MIFDENGEILIKLPKRVRQTAIDSLPDEHFSAEEKERIMDAAIAAAEHAVKGMRDALIAFDRENPDNDECAFAATDFCFSILKQWVERAHEKMTSEYNCGHPDCPVHGDHSDDPLAEILEMLETSTKRRKGPLNEAIEKIRRKIKGEGREPNSEIVIGEDGSDVSARIEELRKMLALTKKTRQLGIGSVKIGCIDKNTGESRLVDMDEEDIAELEKMLAEGDPGEEAFTRFFETLALKHSKEKITIN